MKKIFVIAGEASGDLHGAALIENLKSRGGVSPPMQIFGVGGDKIKATGAGEFFDLAHFHVTGFSQAFLKLPQYFKAEKIILESIRRVKPDVVVLIDNPGFNLHLAKKIHALNIPVIYYIAPQVWAWKKNRIFKIKKYCQKVLVVFDFEKKLYEAYGVPVSFVGHPLKDTIPQFSSNRARKENFVALMPGSRRHEVSVLLPEFLKAAGLLKNKNPEFNFKLIVAPTLPGKFYDPFLEKSPVPVVLVEENSYEAIAGSKLVIACSGTATLECALLKTPVLIANKASFLTYLIANAFLKIPYLGLPNIILNRMAFPELLQYNVTPEKIARAAEEFLKNPSRQAQIQKDLEEISDKLGTGGAAHHAAEEILKNL